MDLLANWPALTINGLALAVIAAVVRKLMNGDLMSRRIFQETVDPLRAEVVERRATDAANQETIRLMANQLAQAHEAAKMGARVMQALQEHGDQRTTTEQPAVRPPIGRATVRWGP